MPNKKLLQIVASLIAIRHWEQVRSNISTRKNLGQSEKETTPFRNIGVAQQRPGESDHHQH